ncbi:MAG TPA: hypothetical protein VFN21_01525 [Acidimicrobiales bacterium]|nr:hypothetical protein [Acidimicrobiales bacterium]
MRTTVALDDEVHETLRRKAFEERRSFTDVLNETLARGLQSETRPRVLGAFTGRIHVADDFDDDLPEIVEALDEPVTP